MKRKKITKSLGFTLIELLVVIGLLAILLSIVLIAINPFEQYAKADDLKRRIATQDLVNTSNIYLTEKKAYPWEVNEACKDEIEAGGFFTNMGECIKEMTGRDKLSKSEKDNLEKTQVHTCREQAVMCYLPSTKEIIPDAIYDKYGVVNPGCPGNKKATDCYWCKRVKTEEECLGGPEPTPSPSTTPIPSPTLTPSPTPIACTRDDVPGYAVNDTKLFRTYGVFLFDYPGFPPGGAGWPIQFSLRPDFGGNYTETINYIAMGSSSSHDYYPKTDSWTKFRIISGEKYAAFYSIAYHPIYTNNCGKTVYWRATAPRYDSTGTKILYTDYGPTNTSVIDCTTKVGVLPINSWYTVYDYATHSQKTYQEEWDLDCSGYIDWTDYWIAAFTTKSRAGGWQFPE